MISVQVQPDGAAPPDGSVTCPGLFYTTSAQDGELLRLRIPGGLLDAAQCYRLASFSECLGRSSLDVTSRANVQIRGLAADGLQHRIAQRAATLIEAQLAAPISSADHLRNIMASPTAGIDPAQRIDTRPLVKALDTYLANQPGLAGLSPKFSIGLDGGERVSIAQQPNDLRFTAVEVEGQIYFRLSLSDIDSAFCWLIQPEDCLAVVATVIQIYLRNVDPALVRKPRLRQVLRADLLQDALRSYLRSESSRPVASYSEYPHLGIHPQRQPERFYIGVALPLGRLETHQLRQLADLAERYGSGTIRLTPWRNLLLPDIASVNLSAVQQQLKDLGLNNHPIWGGLVACAGTTGCSASATDAQADAAALALALAESGARDPLTIHFSGCPKSCAHRTSSDMTLVGDPAQQVPAYSLYVGAGEPFGRLVAANLSPAELPARITNLIAIYDQHCAPDQSFREFANAQPVTQLQVWLAAAGEG